MIKPEYSKIKYNVFQGIRIGLSAFIISFLFSLILAVIMNFTVMDFLKTAILGAISETGATNFGVIIKLSAMIMSASVFNSLADIRLGIFIFTILPFLSFYISMGKENRAEGFTQWKLLMYLIGSIIFTIALSFLLFVTKGELLGMQINFFSIKNMGVTILVTLFIQLIIDLNYNKNAKSYIKSTRLMLRMLFGVGTILALIGLIRMMMTVSISLLAKIGAIIVLLPNFIVYKSFLLMGNNIQTSDSLAGWMAKVSSLQISFQSLSIVMSIIVITIWIVLVVISLLFINKEKFWVDTFIYSVIFSLISAFLAFSTSIKLGDIVLIGNISIGISILQAFLVPLLSINALGLMVWLVRKMLHIIKDI